MPALDTSVAEGLKMPNCPEQIVTILLNMSSLQFFVRVTKHLVQLAQVLCPPSQKHMNNVGRVTSKPALKHQCTGLYTCHIVKCSLAFNSCCLNRLPYFK